MKWTVWAFIVLALLTGGWMLYDGIRALMTGDFTTPTSGAYAGQLGPWSGLFTAIRIDPRATIIKWLFVLVGALWLVSAAANYAGAAWARNGLLAAAILSLWYLPFGTITSIITIALLFFVR